MQHALQFIGTQRSGSNLLRVMLHQHPQISAPHPPHILQMFMPLLPMYGDLDQTGNFYQLIDDVCALVELNPVSWSVKFDRKNIADRCVNRSLPQIMKSIYEVKAESKGASHWCCKSMASIRYADEIEAAGIHPLYIFIFRDGRDVALSFLNAMVGEKHIYQLAKQWKEEQDLSLALCEKTGAERSVKIPYEQFIENPEPFLKSICEKTGLEYLPSMLNYPESAESRETAASGEMWKNLVRPVIKNNTKKFLGGLTREQIELFETIAGDTLAELGYQLEFPDLPARNFSDDELNEFEKLNSIGMEEAKKRASKADMEKRSAQDNFLLQLRKKSAHFHSLIS